MKVFGLTLRDPPVMCAALRANVRKLYAIDGCGSGAGLHVVVDDGNMETESVEGCRDRLDGWMDEWYVGDGDVAEIVALHHVIIGQLLELSEEQRMVASIGYWGQDDRYAGWGVTEDIVGQFVWHLDGWVEH